MPTIEAINSGHKNLIQDCIIKARDGETLWTLLKSGEMITTLIGYAIVPRDEYERLRAAVGDPIDTVVYTHKPNGPQKISPEHPDRPAVP